MEEETTRAWNISTEGEEQSIVGGLASPVGTALIISAFVVPAFALFVCLLIYLRCGSGNRTQEVQSLLKDKSKKSDDGDNDTKIADRDTSSVKQSSRPDSVEILYEEVSPKAKHKSFVERQQGDRFSTVSSAGSILGAILQILRSQYTATPKETTVAPRSVSLISVSDSSSELSENPYVNVDVVDDLDDGEKNPSKIEVEEPNCETSSGNKSKSFDPDDDSKASEEETDEELEVAVPEVDRETVRVSRMISIDEYSKFDDHRNGEQE